ncbi:DUF1345 domain-containing protein [Rhizosaccharibacter radicis]|uniref:DUF1345 domain-containing protein n=1 Tax=Rhizosaccharibacter radicis TaxID=2782605 RepID=A0ABT1VYZ3_9PROT|nr:DUF1345 domain-containing protein [Acetobacteraceae bacterium KSS12]
MMHALHHLRHRPALSGGLVVALIAGLAAGAWLREPITSVLIGWNLGVLGYAAMLARVVWRSSVDGLRRSAAELDEGRWSVLLITVGASVASLLAIVALLARVHGHPHAGWTEALAGLTVILSWFFVHAVFATHYAHEFWREPGGGLQFPGNDRPDYVEFLYFAFCLAVASQVSDVTTESAAMRRLVLVHSLVAFLFNTAVVALGVNIAASLAG